MPGAGHPDGVEPGPHHALVLGVDQRLRAGPDGHAVGLQGPQVLGRHVLVVEGDHIAAGREAAQRVEVAVVAEDGLGDHLRGGVLGRVGEEFEPDPERDARLVCHPGQLPAADHAHYWKIRIARGSHPARISGPVGGHGTAMEPYGRMGTVPGSEEPWGLSRSAEPGSLDR